jgi:hypothetical protein
LKKGKFPPGVDDAGRGGIIPERKEDGNNTP